MDTAKKTRWKLSDRQFEQLKQARDVAQVQALQARQSEQTFGSIIDLIMDFHGIKLEGPERLDFDDKAHELFVTGQTPPAVVAAVAAAQAKPAKKGKGVPVPPAPDKTTP